MDASFYIAKEVLPFKFDNEDIDGNLKISFQDSKGAEVKCKHIKVDKKFGDNRYIINLRKVGDFKEGQLYYLQVINSKGEIYRLRFKYQRTRDK
jgi:hypothetical protein